MSRIEVRTQRCVTREAAIEPLSDDVGVRLAFLANSARRAVAANKRHVIAERQQLRLDRADQQFGTTAGQIGATDRALEQHIANEGEPLRSIEQHDRAGRMSWAMENFAMYRDGYCIS